MTDPKLLLWSLVEPQHESSSLANLVPVTLLPEFTESCPVCPFRMPSFFPSLLVSQVEGITAPIFYPFLYSHTLPYLLYSHTFTIWFCLSSQQQVEYISQLLILGENAIMPVLILGLQEALCSHLLFCIPAFTRHKEQSCLSQPYLDEVTPSQPKDSQEKNNWFHLTY